MHRDPRPPPAILKVMPQCPLPLARLVAKMLKKQRRERPASYEELIAQIESVRAQLDPTLARTWQRLRAGAEGRRAGVTGAAPARAPASHGTWRASPTQVEAPAVRRDRRRPPRPWPRGLAGLAEGGEASLGRNVTQSHPSEHRLPENPTPALPPLGNAAEGTRPEGRAVGAPRADAAPGLDRLPDQPAPLRFGVWDTRAQVRRVS